MTCKTLAQDIDQAIAATSNTASDSFVFTRNATAYKIPFSSMSSSLGVTGTINTVGAPTSVAILNKPSAGYNYIRNIAPSQGITATLDAYGSIAIKTNFINGTGDATVINDTAAVQTKFKGFTGGSGITITETADTITISLT